MSQLYKVNDNDGMGLLSWTKKYPTTKRDIMHQLSVYHKMHETSIPITRWAYLPSFKNPTLEDLLKVYNLELEAVI